jgi:hypothetical protein
VSHALGNKTGTKQMVDTTAAQLQKKAPVKTSSRIPQSQCCGKKRSEQEVQAQRKSLKTISVHQ